MRVSDLPRSRTSDNRSRRIIMARLCRNLNLLWLHTSHRATLVWKESKIGRKRRGKVEFDLTLLAGKAKTRSIGLTPARDKNKKKRGDIVLLGGKEAKKHMKQFDSTAALAHE